MNGKMVGLRKESRNQKASSRPSQSLRPCSGPECGLRPTSDDLNLNFQRKDDGMAYGGWLRGTGKWMGRMGRAGMSLKVAQSGDVAERHARTLSCSALPACSTLAIRACKLTAFQKS